jgi:hypothetical protein
MFMVDGVWDSLFLCTGQKVTQRYYFGEGYVETDVHVGSSSIAANITGTSAFLWN